MSQSRFRLLSFRSRLYVSAITIAGAATVVYSLIQVGEGKIPPYWLILAALTVFSASVPIRLHAIPVTLSVSETFVFTSALLFGPAAATLTVAIDAAVISFWSFRRGQSTYKIAFNICALPLTIWISAHLFFWVGGFAPLFESKFPFRRFLDRCCCDRRVLSTQQLAHYTGDCLRKGVRPFKIWYENFAWISLNYFGGASVAALVVSYIDTPNVRSLVIVVALIPLLALLYKNLFSQSRSRTGRQQTSC